jgi:signal transduction histidine kinase
MINDLLDVSKMEAGVLALNNQNVEPTSVLRVALQHVAPLAREKNIKLVPQFPDGLPTLLADEEKLVRTMVNLIGNAVKFTPVDGTIIVTARAMEKEPALQFAVADTGEGIPFDAFGRIFEKFGQVESRKAGQVHSTGLGLTFCKMTVEAHGGRIWVESDIGKGSVFSFTIPLTDGCRRP